ncbi:NRDE family protein [Microbacterium gilvum]|uniref:NRDE family protein n=1 Tax=Microbacterium gilvum TaxID=1336204 RepID=A0ABP9ADT8_9MICO
MCTVVIRVPEDAAQPIRLLAVRDEDPLRPWNPLGARWPERPQLTGVQDRLAGGAWLAAEGGRLAVLLNRAGAPLLPSSAITSRGGIVLDAVGGRLPGPHPTTLGFNLVSVAGGRAELVSWDGDRLSREVMPAGTHMIAHDGLDDRATPRIATWRDAFAAAPAEGDGAWWEPWLAVLTRSTTLSPEDDRAIIRDNRVHGYPTQSLLACVTSVTPTTADIRYAELETAGRWNPLQF